eukprot:4891447-Pyramimonas_sp.AAC.2
MAALQAADVEKEKLSREGAALKTELKHSKDSLAALGKEKNQLQARARVPILLILLSLIGYNYHVTHRERERVWGVECILAVIGTGGPAK